MAFTFLRDSFYADFLPLMAQDGVIRGPAGDGQVAAVAREDVAAVAAVCWPIRARMPARHTTSPVRTRSRSVRRPPSSPS